MDVESVNGSHFREWTDIQHVYDLIANEDAHTLDPYDPIPEFNDDLIDVFASSFGLPPSPILPSNADLSEPVLTSTTDIEFPETEAPQLKQLLLSKTKSNGELKYYELPGRPTETRTRKSQSPDSTVVPFPVEETDRVTRTRDSSTSIKSKEARTYSKPAPKTLKFPPCFICGGKASGLHYGVNSCEACKGFFRRYLIRNEEYKCPKGGNCQIVNRNRENCSGCRLKKCFDLGMSKDKSKLGRYTLSRRTETIKKVKALERKESRSTGDSGDPAEVASPSPIYYHNRDHNYSEAARSEERDGTVSPCQKNGDQEEGEDRLQLLWELVRAMEEIKPYGADTTSKADVDRALRSHHERYKVKIEMYGEMKSIPKQEYYKLLKEYGIDIDGRMNALKVYVAEIERVTERYCNFAKLIPGFKQLPRRDQSTLLKADRCDFFLILMNDAYSTKYQTILSRNGLAYHVEEIADKHFSRELITKICQTYLRWQKLGLRKEEKALIIAITLFFTDRCKIEDRKGVEKIQLSLVAMLRSQLEKTHKSGAVRRFAKIIDCLTFMRDSSEMYIREYKELCDDETVVEAVPMLTEFLLEDW